VFFNIQTIVRLPDETNALLGLSKTIARSCKDPGESYPHDSKAWACREQKASCDPLTPEVPMAVGQFGLHPGPLVLIEGLCFLGPLPGPFVNVFMVSGLPFF
jgi:hypothetical protein